MLGSLQARFIANSNEAASADDPELDSVDPPLPMGGMVPGKGRVGAMVGAGVGAGIEPNGGKPDPRLIALTSSSLGASALQVAFR